MGKLKVSVRGGFSDRNNIKTVNTEMQVTSLDERTRIKIVNTFNLIFSDVFGDDSRKENMFWIGVMSEVYNQPVDYSPNVIYSRPEMIAIINTTIMEDDYDDVLSLIEYIVRVLNYQYKKTAEAVTSIINDTFIKEYVGYRFVKNMIVPITDPEENESISNALDISNQYVRMHMEKAINMISNRDHPDYENSVKESITAVEAMCNVLLGESDTLGKSLKKLMKSEYSVQSCFKEAMGNIYGYTNNAQGIRHAGELEENPVTFDEAKYVLVTCSAFINYLKAISSRQAGADHE